MMRFYPDDASVPEELRTHEFLLRPMRTADAELDYDATMATQEMLRLRSGGAWPPADFTLEEHAANLRWHAAEFSARSSFTYTIVNPLETQCLGCVYIYPLHELLYQLHERLRAKGDDERTSDLIGDYEAGVTFWVRQDRLADDLDRRVLAALLSWLRNEFAFSRVVFAAWVVDERQVAIVREAGLQMLRAYPVRGSELLLFTWGGSLLESP